MLYIVLLIISQPAQPSHWSDAEYQICLSLYQNSGISFDDCPCNPDNAPLYIDPETNEPAGGGSGNQDGVCCLYQEQCLDYICEDLCIIIGGSWLAYYTCSDFEGEHQCVPDPNYSQVGQCCLPDTTCIVVNEYECNCMGGTWGGAGGDCVGAMCAMGEPPADAGACCIPSEGVMQCIEIAESQCFCMGGIWKYEDFCSQVDCNDTCDSPWICCIMTPDGQVLFCSGYPMSGESCVAYALENFGPDAVAYEYPDCTVCIPPTQDMWACCLPDGSCILAATWDCIDLGGVQHYYQSCESYDCTVEHGACCVGTTCYNNWDVQQCEGIGGQFYGGSNCLQVSCEGEPPSTYGACCIQVSGDTYQCLEQRTQINCQQLNGIWYSNQMCASVDCDGDPPNLVGACCYMDPNSNNLLCFDNAGYSDCVSVAGVWYPGVTCGPGTCVPINNKICECLLLTSLIQTNNMIFQELISQGHKLDFMQAFLESIDNSVLSIEEKLGISTNILIGISETTLPEIIGLLNDISESLTSGEADGVPFPTVDHGYIEEAYGVHADSILEVLPNYNLVLPDFSGRVSSTAPVLSFDASEFGVSINGYDTTSLGYYEADLEMLDTWGVRMPIHAILISYVMIRMGFTIWEEVRRYG